MAAAVTGRSIGSALVLLLVVAVVAGCGTDGASPFASTTSIEKEFIAAVTTWDLNRDGDVTCEEWKVYVADLFREADADRDGMLTREEFAVMARRDRLFETVGFNYFDGNGDGRLTLAEIADKPNPAFTLLDANRDCRITPEERAGPPKGKR